MSYSNIILETDGPIATLTVNRPNALNALDALTFDEIEAAVTEVGNDESVRVLIVTGSGEKAFVAGADIPSLRELESADEGAKLSRRGQEVFDGVEGLEKPVIAAINGFALGGGLEFAMSCDLRIAADTAKMGLPEINLGLLPGYGGSQRLPRLVGAGRAKKIMYTGEFVDAAEALRIGLVEEVVPASELMATALALAEKLATKAPVAMALAKRAVNEGLESDLDRGNLFEASLFGIACGTADRVEGTSAFLEKRKPVWKGR